MRLVAIGDLHLAARPPRMRTATYAEDILTKLGYVMGQADALNADAVLISGDLFHTRNPASTPHWLVQRVSDALRATTRPKIIVPGNHDQNARAGASMIDGQPLGDLVGQRHIGVAEWAGLYTFQHMVPMSWSHMDYPVLCLPWQAQFAETEEEALHWLEILFDKLGWQGADVMVAHAPLTLESNPFGPEPRGWVSMQAFEDRIVSRLHPRPRVVVHGHMHAGHKPMWANAIASQTCYVNPGALSRGSIADSDRLRTPQFAVINIDDDPRHHYDIHLARVHVEYRPVPCRPPEEAFLLNEHATESERSVGLQALTSAFARAYEHIVTKESLVDALEQVTRPDGIDEDTWRAGLGLARAALEEQQ